MVAPKIIKIKSLADFASEIEKLVNGAGLVGNWYRGVGRSESHTLKPALYRHSTAVEIEDLLKIEAKMLQDFLRSTVLHDGLNDDSEKETLKTLFFMQHYGVPTRLLDWTTNPFIALYFALTSADATVEDAAVWVLDPVAWNEKVMQHVSWDKGGPMHYTDITLNNYGPYKLHRDLLDAAKVKSLLDGPACILGISNNARMFAQRGVFAMFGKSLLPMEVQFNQEKYPAKSLTKLVIPKNLIDSLLQLLLKLGYTDSVSYPDLGGLAMEIRRSYGFKA